METPLELKAHNDVKKMSLSSLHEPPGSFLNKREANAR